MGTQASGSTWLFNAVRLLCDAAGQPAIGFSADDALGALDAMPLDVRNVVLKSHGMDQRLLKFARMADAKLLISTRDPRDSVVSQRERFGLTLHQASMDISRALATITSLPDDMPVLRFAYEDRFTDKPETIAHIGRFLGIEASDRVVEEIFEALAPQKVRLRIEQWLTAHPPDVVPAHDPVEQWHAQHISDGKVGKWVDRLDLASQVVVTGCLSGMTSIELNRGEPLMWSAQMFTTSGEMSDDEVSHLACSGAAEFLSYGPYLCIPRGRWRATPLVRSLGYKPVKLEADIYLPWDDHQVVRCIGTVSAKASSLVLEFDHHDYYQPLEARLMSVGWHGKVAFRGWLLHFLGPVD